MQITVYAEHKGTAEEIAVFPSEELYERCFVSLKGWAFDNGFTAITESIEES